MNNNVRRVLPTAILATLAALPAGATTVIYQNDFEAPAGFIGGFATGGVIYADTSQQSVNALYGASFGQTFTVETLNVSGGSFSGAGPGNDYALGMLSSLQPDLLWLTFDVSGFDFVNVALDISAIDLNGSDGATLVAPGVAPAFRISLHDGAATASVPPAGALLDAEDIAGTSTTLDGRYVFDWTSHVVALSTLGNATGIVTLQIDLLAGGYAAFDNLTIASSDQPGDVGQVPLPGGVWLLGSALLALGFGRRRPD